MKHLLVETVEKRKYLESLIFRKIFILGQLVCIQAYDPDEGNNGRVIYSFDHSDDKLAQFLYLNNETGCLSLIQPLLLTSVDLIPLLQFNNHLLLTIRAQDCGSRMSSTLPAYHPLEIIIEDINDHKPHIEVRQIVSSIDVINNNSRINIAENTIGLLAMITVDDIDQGIYGQVQLNLIVQTSIKKHRQAFQLKPTSIKHYKVSNMSLKVNDKCCHFRILKLSASVDAK